MNTTEVSASQELAWYKSSYSGAEGGDCVEVAWRKSTYSVAEGGECVEFSASATRVRVRDSKQGNGPVLALGPGAWARFVGLVTG
ncbi:DUF397 domain-containing protein [Streptomyces sp. NPDC049970]|uniref:DUF397 domain-containing protein n=1 Tax=Streptomyces sp. NPDC049970 TaxID=3155033 RepID=UPI00342D58E8